MKKYHVLSSCCTCGTTRVVSCAVRSVWETREPEPEPEPELHDPELVNVMDAPPVSKTSDPLIVRTTCAESNGHKVNKNTSEKQVNPIFRHCKLFHTPVLQDVLRYTYFLTHLTITGAQTHCVSHSATDHHDS